MKGLERVYKPLLEYKAKLLPPKQSVKYKCQTWSKITRKFSKKCLDASSPAEPPLHHWFELIMQPIRQIWQKNEMFSTFSLQIPPTQRQRERTRL